MTNAVYCAYGDEHVAMAAKSAQTFKKHTPGAQVFVYVDKHYDADIEQIICPHYFSQPFMVANIMCQFDWLATSRKFEPTYFLDNDVIMMRPAPRLEYNDLYVTWRDDVGELSKAQPYNYGVLIASPDINTIRAFAWLEDRVRKLSPQRQKWYGNQIALRELVGPLTKEPVVRNFGYFDLSIEQLPCRTWNWSPPEDKLKQNAGDKIFVHLKGERKSAFDYYYQKSMEK